MCSPNVSGFASARDRVLAELCALAAPGSAPLGADELAEHIKDLCAFADQVQGQLARLTAALDRAGGPVSAGFASSASFLRGACGRTPGHAMELVALGRGLSRLPVTAKAVDAGEVSADAALIITRATADLATAAHPSAGLGAAAVAEQAEHIMVGVARAGATTTGLRQLGEEIAYRADPGAADERERRRWEKRYLSFGLTLGQTGVLSGMCGDAVSFEIVRTAAEAFAPPGGACDTRTAAQRRMDGLVAACKAALDGGHAPLRHGAAPHVSVLVRDETLARAEGAPPARSGHGAMLTARQVLALCCGAQLTAIRWEDGLPLDVGRSARTEPPALRRALQARDRGCRWPGCDAPALWCTAHHIAGWVHGADTSLTGLVLLCHLHHAYFVHMLGWTIAGDPNATLSFTHPDTGLTLQSPLPCSEPRAP
jgi:uncharacterized protein DUF222